MDRMACVDLPALPLQILLRAHPQWRERPAVQVDRDAPHGSIVCVNDAARRLGVQPGMRYSAALGLCAQLCADTVAPSAIQNCVAELTQFLQRFSPGVEAANDPCGTFWLDTRGLTPLYRSLSDWTRAIGAELAAAGFTGSIAVGFRRFATAAIARALAPGRAALFECARDEHAALMRVPLEHAGLEPGLCAELAKLGVESLGDLIELPAQGLLQRLGPEVHRVHRLARGDLCELLAPAPVSIPPHADVEFELPEIDRGRLLARCTELSEPLLAGIERRGEVVAALEIELGLDDGRAISARLAPAEPTRDPIWLARLLELRLEALELAPGVVRVAITLTAVSPRRAQTELFVERPRRDPSAAAKAIDALKALFGEQSVVCARLQDAHLPEARFLWTPCAAPPAPKPRTVDRPSLVRRIFHTPRALAPLAPHASDGWLLRGVTHGSVERLIGPHLLSGGWWQREVERDYHYAALQNGELYWIYHDRRRRRWFLQGNVS